MHRKRTFEKNFLFEKKRKPRWNITKIQVLYFHQNPAGSRNTMHWFRDQLALLRSTKTINAHSIDVKSAKSQGLLNVLTAGPEYSSFNTCLVNFLYSPETFSGGIVMKHLPEMGWMLLTLPNVNKYRFEYSYAVSLMNLDELKSWCFYNQL